MKRVLKPISRDLYYFVGSEKQDGKNPDMLSDCTRLSGNCSGLYGDCTRLSGNCSGLSGDCSGLSGDCTRLYGDCTGLSGDCTGLRGDLDKAGITDEDRKKGVSIKELIEN